MSFLAQVRVSKKDIQQKEIHKKKLNNIRGYEMAWFEFRVVQSLCDINIINVPFMYHWTASWQMIVTEGDDLSTWFTSTWFTSTASRLKCVICSPSCLVFKEYYCVIDRLTLSCIHVKQVHNCRLHNYGCTLALNHPTSLKWCTVCECVHFTHRESKSTHMHALSSFSKFLMETAHEGLTGWSHPTLGHSCSLKPSSQPSPDPSVLSAPPPVTSSSSYYPVEGNNHEIMLL